MLLLAVYLCFGFIMPGSFLMLPVISVTCRGQQFMAEL